MKACTSSGGMDRFHHAWPSSDRGHFAPALASISNFGLINYYLYTFC